MKKIFYSMMAVALCACSQSDVDDNMVAPQPENNGLKFTVVDNGFINEDGTRVKYDDGENGVGTAITSTFEEGNTIGIYALKSSLVKTVSPHDKDAYIPDSDAAYTVKNVKLTFTNGVWVPEESINLGEADLVFAYAPYRNVDLNNGVPSFNMDEKGNYTVDENNNRFFVWPWNSYRDNSTKALFDEADWMGAATMVESGQTEVKLNMKHMRGMVEVITHKDVKLTDITMTLSGGSKYQFNAYFANEKDANRKKNVYRILIAEHRNNGNTVYVTIEDEKNGVTKKYSKDLPAVTTGTCFRLTVPYKPAERLTVSSTESLDALLKANYGANYKTNPELASLRLAGTLSQDDWTTLSELTTLTTLNLSDLENTEIPANWLNSPTTNATTDAPETDNMASVAASLTAINLPSKLQTIGNYAFCHCYSLSVCISESSLQTIGKYAFSGVKAVYTDPSNVDVLKIPTSVTTISKRAFENMSGLRKVVFQTPTAPTTLEKDAFALMPKVTFHVPAKDAYKDKFPTGRTVIVGPALTTDNYQSQYTHLTESKGILGLCDNEPDTFWHSIYWNGTHTYSGDEKYGQYIDITLPDGVTMNSLMVRYTTRQGSPTGTPSAVDIYTSTDGNTWTLQAELTKDQDKGNLPQTGGTTYLTSKMTPAASFTKVRFAIKAVTEQNKSLCGPIGADGNNFALASAALAELTIGEEIFDAE